MGGGGDIQFFGEGETSHFIGGLDNPLETMLYYLTLKVYERPFIISQ